MGSKSSQKVRTDQSAVSDRASVAALLGRAPAGPFEVVVRSADGTPAVIANAPFFDDGTPMPTRYWLVDRALREAVSRLEASGGVRQAERVVDGNALVQAHNRYAAERDRLVSDHYEGPRPVGGVGGTSEGVKCLHAHLAWWLAGGDDPVGDWVAAQLEDVVKELLSSRVPRAHGLAAVEDRKG